MKARIVETKDAQKTLKRLPLNILRSYEIWARLVEEHGSQILREFKGYHTEKLTGELRGFSSSRLNNKWRVVYRLDREGLTEVLELVEVCKITPHDYRRK
jgi:plasmid maintenance system killer protein